MKASQWRRVNYIESALLNIFSASIYNIVSQQWAPITGEDRQGCRHSSLPLPPHPPSPPPPFHLPDAGGGLASAGLPAGLIPFHASPWPGERQWGCWRRQMAARRTCWTWSPLLFEQSCDDCIQQWKKVKRLASFKCNGQFKQVEAHLEQHLEVFVSSGEQEMELHLLTLGALAPAGG